MLLDKFAQLIPKVLVLWPAAEIHAGKCTLRMESNSIRISIEAGASSKVN